MTTAADNHPGRLERAVQVFREHHGLLRTSVAARAGVHPATLYALRDAGVVTQMARGLYQLGEREPLSNPDLATVGAKVPKAVICLISALDWHDLTTQIPHEVHLALPKAARAPRLSWPPLRVYRFSEPAYSAGAQTHEIDGVPVRIYSPEKTLADCFKFRNQVGLDTVLEALKEYLRRGHPNVDDLVRYSEICRVRRVMRPYLEALL
jgi:predicted transcriptional regulator of viral defense system